MSCTVVLLVISTASRMRYGNPQCFKQKLFGYVVKLYTEITNVIKLVDGKKLQIYFRIKEN